MTTTFIFAGGGSGGHIYPGLAVADELRRLAQPGCDVRCIFLCSDRALDAEILSRSGYPFVRSPARPIIMRPRGLVRFLAGWGRSVRESRALIREHSAHGIIHLVAMGGFVAAPAVQAARAEHAPVTMVNLDAIPGKANRWIARRVPRVITAASVPERFSGPHWTQVPPIVRAASRPRADQPACRAALGLDPHRPVLMITGGSQGIRTVNAFVTAFGSSEHGQKTLRDGRWQVIHQTGKNEDEKAALAWRTAGIDALVQPFTDRMGDWWGAADLAVCTAGAGNVAEIWQSKTPAMLLPYPYHRDQHQKFNAAALQARGGVTVVTDHIDAAANVRENGPELQALLADPARRAQMREGLASLGPADGAERIARTLLDLSS